MKLLRFPCLVASLFGALALRAGPVESAIVAAMKLAEQPNYSWIATIDDDVRTYDVIGMTRPDGFTRLRMPMTDSIRRRLGRSAIDSMLDVIYRGKAQCVVATADGWKAVNELPWIGERRTEANFASMPPGGLMVGGLPGIGIMGSVGVPTSSSRARRPRSRSEVAATENYSSLQLGLSHPHEELSVIVSSHADIRCDGDTTHGTLNEIGALLLLVHDDEADIDPQRAAGTFKLWTRNGIVTKYQVKLEGVLVCGVRTFEVQQTRTTVLKDFGVTQFQVPDEARIKLGR